MLYSLRVLVVVEQPSSSQFFHYSPVKDPHLHCSAAKFTSGLHVHAFCAEACVDAFSWLKVSIRLGFFASPSEILVCILGLWKYLKAACQHVDSEFLRKPLQLWGTHHFLLRSLRALQFETCLFDTCFCGKQC